MLAPLAFTLGWAEILLILIVLLLLFGTSRLPKLGRSVGKTIVEFKQGMADAKAIGNSQGEQKALDSKQSPPAGTSEQSSEKAGTSDS
ncbi:MAG: twin-arginine translocase TatA/TatE family subunit [Planctomycetota bacterium]|nr:MAG: twin-arginine translocase TatA/TatE family subunit [Planctomycetota bacterium]